MADTHVQDRTGLARARTVDSMDALSEPINALAAIEELLCQSTREFMGDVNSGHFTALVTLVSRELYVRADEHRTRLGELLSLIREA